MEAGLVVRGEVVEEAMDLEWYGEGSLACCKAISDLPHASHIVNCAVTRSEGDGEVLLEKGAGRADVATLKHCLELGPNEGGAHLASLKAAHEGVGEGAEEDGAGAVASGTFRCCKVVMMHRNFMLRLADEVLAAMRGGGRKVASAASWSSGVAAITKVGSGGGGPGGMEGGGGSPR
ncbi:unnamed protein product [Closterium sp. Naga37s-1]|nr:unnamed protein product [Closterium sp. Naga37s-1]